MNIKTITTPNFTGSIAKIIEEVRNSTFIDKIDAAALEKILQDELNEYCTMVDEEYYIAITSAQHRAYDEGHSDGYDDGYENGYADCHAKNHY